MILLDTNVVSEVMKAVPDTAVVAWVDKAPRATVLVASVTEAELLYGVALSAPGRRREGLARAINPVRRSEERRHCRAAIPYIRRREWCLPD